MTVLLFVATIVTCLAIEFIIHPNSDASDDSHIEE